jgi:VanZ family protein
MTSLLHKLLKSKKRTRTLAILWTLLILAACLIPGREVPNVHIPLADKWVHFIIFAGFSFLWLSVFDKAKAGHGWLVFLLSVSLGYVVELLQGSGITTGRSYDLYDVLADAIGGALGVLLFFLMRRQISRTR